MGLMPPPDRIRVLLLAEMCNPAWTSVPLVGYHLARALAQHPALEVTVVTQVRNRSYLEADPLRQHADVCYIDNEAIARPMHRLARLLRRGDRLSWTLDTAMMWPGYVVYEQMVQRRFGHDLDRGRFDLIHRITPLSPTIPSPLASLCRTPMVLGPINGGLPWPKDHPDLRWREREWFGPFRKLSRLLPYYRSTYRCLSGLITGSRFTAAQVPAYFRGLRLSMPENGVDPERFPLASRWPEPHGPFRFISVARLVPLKGLDIILEALAGSERLRTCELVVAGEGPERPRLERMARERGLPGVRFLGWLDQRALAQELQKAQAFVLPSLKEFGGGVILEAMAAALPCVVVDYGGPAELVADETGIRLPMCRRPELISRLRHALEQLAEDFPRCRSLGAAAARVVRQEHVWSAKAERIVEFYRDLLAARLPSSGRAGCLSRTDTAAFSHAVATPAQAGMRSCR
jgi:glycosyltransferase involved in cell wall biosynthesis